MVESVVGRYGPDDVERIEKLIRYDLGFDGHDVDFIRLADIGAPCADVFRWAFNISERSELARTMAKRRRMIAGSPFEDGMPERPLA
jgi:hypothetical protein